jgi:hypothetical protein
MISKALYIQKYTSDEQPLSDSSRIPPEEKLSP